MLYDFPFVHHIFRDVEYHSGINIGCINDWASVLEDLYLPSSNELPTSHHTYPTYDTKGLIALTPTCATEIKSMVLVPENQTNNTRQFQMCPASFSMSPESATDDSFDDKCLERKPGEGSMSNRTMQIHLKPNILSSVEQSSLLSNPLCQNTGENHESGRYDIVP
jgi:hypothetical protein